MITYPETIMVSSFRFYPYYFIFYFSEHASLPDHKGCGGQRWTDRIFPLHRQWPQEGQLSPLAAGLLKYYLSILL